MLRRGVFLYLEDELMHFNETKKEIDRLRRDILHGSGMDEDENIGGGKSNLPGDTTGRKAIALASNAKLDRMERLVESIQSVFERLQPEKRKMIQMMYWDRPKLLTWEGVALKLHITKRTAGRWRKEIIHAIADRGGYK